MEGYELGWADEFENDGKPDPANWTYETGFVRNEELQWYQAPNAMVSDGMLVIEARRVRRTNPWYREGSTDWPTARRTVEYTSASLTTRGLHAWTYGRFEMRARIDTRPGLWPAFWTLGADGEWPYCGEIDIMEYYRGMVLANVAWGSGERFRPVWDDLRKLITDFDDPDWSEKFHVWRMDWDREAIRLYLDGRLLNETPLSRTANPKGHAIENPFHRPQYIILNLAVGGTSGGDPSATEFPARFEVDYVRVYRKAE